MSLLVEQIANGLAVGCTYALIALGYNLTFGVLRIVNLAYGEVFMVASYAAVVLAAYGASNAIVLWAAGLGAAVLTGLVVHLVAVRPLGNVSDIGSPRHLQVLVSTIGCSLILQNAALLVFGGYPRRFPRILGESYLMVASIRLESSIVLTAAAAVVLMIGLALVIRSSDFGLRLRAVADNRQLAVLSGMRTSRDELLCVGLSSAIAGVAAMLISEVIGTVSPFIGSNYGMKGLIVLIVGKAGNMIGAVVVGVGLGLLEVLVSAYWSSSYRDGIAFAVLVLVILVVGSRDASEGVEQ